MNGVSVIATFLAVVTLAPIPATDPHLPAGNDSDRSPINPTTTSRSATPDGKTLYGAALNKVIPISTATNTPGKPIRPVRTGYPREIVIAP